MPVMRVRGVDLVYEILGDQGPLVTLTPGGRRSGGAERTLANLIADAGFRVLIHDRRNMGGSGIAFAGDSESLEQAEDLRTLLRALDVGRSMSPGAHPAPACRCCSRVTTPMRSRPCCSGG